VDGSEIRYTRSGDVDIAWTVTGRGPIDIVYVAGFISHLDLARELSVYGSLLGRLDRLGRVLAFDKRGTGLSGRDLGFGSLAERADDIRAVMDAADLERAHLFGVSEGGPLSLLFAATNPERVQSLALYGSFACLLPDDDPASAAFDTPRFLEHIEGRWGTGEVLGALVHAPPDPAILDQLGRYERACASPHLAAEIMRSNLKIDARPILPAISAPTLVVHRTGDPIVGIVRARAMADALRHAEFVEIPGDMHCAWDAQEWAPALDVIEEFLTGMPPAVADVDRTFATVLFTDIVNSTKSAVETGDRVWRDILDRHDSQTRRVVEQFGGRVVKHTGDGSLATFDSPARAVHCARVVRDTLGREGVTIRAGLHTGEIERRGDDISGICVNIGARIAAIASPNEILVSRTVHDLVEGSDLRFIDRGLHPLKGVSTEWQVFASI
jgi:class 3 adenylate cyclase/pimeloyl-ACP methyl ester carboxylesterase